MSTSTVKSFIGESSVDLCIRSYSHIEGLIKFCIDNGLAIDNDELVEAEHIIDDALKADLRNRKPLFGEKPKPKQEKVFVNTGQNLVDLALQETGGVEGLISILKNNGYELADVPLAGEEVKTLTGDVVNEDVKLFYRGSNYKVNTGFQFSLPEMGIGYMIIEDSLIVS